MALLTQFLLRLAFGLAAAMATVSPRLVTSGYFRNHLYVTLGLASLAALLARIAAPAALGGAITAAILSYAGAVAWLYERRRWGVAALVAVAVAALAGALAATTFPLVAAPSAAPSSVGALPTALRYLQTVASGLVLGTATASMLLGHWYLNVPGMELAPLRKLLLAMLAAVALQAVVCGAGLALGIAAADLSTQDGLFLLLRWSFGLVGVAVMIVMAWQTLAIPNTQSATGILYVAVMGAFVGETMSLLLSAESLYPI